MVKIMLFFAAFVPLSWQACSCLTVHMTIW